MTEVRSRASGAPTFSSGQALRRSGWFARFPVTALLLLEYAILAVWPAWLHHDQDAGFLYWIVGVGLGTAFASEYLLAHAHTGSRVITRDSIVTPRLALITTIIGVTSMYVSVMLGARTFAAQVGATGVSPLAQIVTPFISWALIGSAFTFYCFAKKSLTKRQAVLRISITACAYCGYVLLIGTTAPLAGYLLAVAAGAIFTGATRPRVLLAAILGALILWPVLFGLRNATRSSLVTVGTYGANISASDRLREDLLLSAASRFPAPMNLPNTSILTAVHYGLIPSALDPFPRPDLSTSKSISVALGSSDENSVGFTIFGNIRAVGGTPVLIAVMIALSIIMSIAGRALSPTRLVILMAVPQSMLWIESIYPDDVAGVLQTLVSALVVLIFAHIVKLFSDAIARRNRPAPVLSERLLT